MKTFLKIGDEMGDEMGPLGEEDMERMKRIEDHVRNTTRKFYMVLISTTLFMCASVPPVYSIELKGLLC